MTMEANKENKVKSFVEKHKTELMADNNTANDAVDGASAYIDRNGMTYTLTGVFNAFVDFTNSTPDGKLTLSDLGKLWEMLEENGYCRPDAEICEICISYK